MINLKSQGPGSDARFRAAGLPEQPGGWQPGRGRAQSHTRPDPCSRWPGLGEARLDTGLCTLRLDRTQAAGSRPG